MDENMNVANHEIDPVFGIDTRLLRHMAESILTANNTNPSSWSVNQLVSGSLVLFVEAVTVMVIRQDGGDLAFLGSVDGIESEDLRDSIRAADYGGLSLVNLSPDQFHIAYTDYVNEHNSLIVSRAQAVRTRTQRANEHRQALVDEIEEILGIDLPEPAYFGAGQTSGIQRYRSADVSPSGYWKQTISPTQTHLLEEWRRHNVMTLDLWKTLDLDLAEWPNERGDFVRLARQLDEIGTGAGHRMWMFAKGMQIGDKVFVHDQWNKPLLIGEVEGHYQLLSGNGKPSHQRAVRWMDVSHVEFPEDHPASSAFSRSLWGLTVMEPAHFTAISSMVGFPKYDLARWDESVLREIATSIAEADGENPRSWVLRWLTDEIALYVGVSKVLAASPQSSHLLVSGTPNSFDEIADGAMKLSLKNTKETSATWIGDIPVATAGAIFDRVREAHHKVLRLAAGSAASKANDHDALLLGALSARLNTTLPTPAHAAHETPTPAARTSSTVGSSLLPVYMAASGLKYTTAQTASFYTALQTKGFVILSGISGTGKSKIAQRFAETLPASVRANTRKLRDGSTLLRLKLWPYMTKYNRFAVPKSHASLLPKPEPGTSIEVSIQVDSVIGEGRFGVSTPGDGVLTEVHLKGDAAKRFQGFDVENFYVDFELSDDGAVGTIKIWSEVPETETDAAGVFLPNHLFLPVRPDWRDGKALIGYHNPLSGEYVRTDFLEFVMAAADDYRAGNRNAFFVILDEMNLAHVEYYFADVLSVIESGRDEDGWTVEGIPLAVGEEDADLPESLRLPPNLYIVGTVNMDETTHPFSPKVLDRAFTIELTEVDFSDYPPEPAGSTELDDAEKQALLDAFTRQGRYPRIDKREIAELVDRHPKFRDDLQSLNASLRRSRMHFGYRVFDEIMQFVFNAEGSELFTAEDAFDHAVLMKVLPKFNGSRGKLQAALFELIHWCRSDGAMSAGNRSELEARFSQLIDQGQPFDSIVTAGVDTVEDNWRYPATGRRAALMMQDLYTEGFASFG